MTALLSVVLVVVVLFGVPLALAIHRSNELFVLEVEEGRTRFVRGRLPHALHRDLTDLLSATHCSGRVRVTVERGLPVIATRGTFDDGTLQRLRNVIGNTPLARIRAGAKPAKGRRR